VIYRQMERQLGADEAATGESQLDSPPVSARRRMRYYRSSTHSIGSDRSGYWEGQLVVYRQMASEPRAEDAVTDESQLDSPVCSGRRMRHCCSACSSGPGAHP